METRTNQAEETRTRRRPRRSPNFPYVDLEAAALRLKEMYEAESVHEAPLTSVAKHWGYSPTSGSLDKVLAALIAYGLVETQGSGRDRCVKISERGRDIVERHDSPERTKAVQAAALAPSFYQTIRTKYGTTLPSADTIRTWMVRDLEFNPKSVEGAVANYLETMRYACLDGSEPIDNEAVEKSETITVGSWVLWESQGKLQFPGGPRRVVRIEEHQGDKYVFVVDSNGVEGAIPIADAIAADPNSGPSESPPLPPLLGTGTPPAPPLGIVDDLYSLDAGRNVLIRSPEQLTDAEYNEVCDFFELLKRKLRRRVTDNGE